MNKILVIGDLMIDNYLFGSCYRISPESPVPVVEIEREQSVLGGAGNVVNNILALEAEVDILSVVGDCENTNLLLDIFNKSNISPEFLITENGRTTSKKTRIIASKQQIVRVDRESTDSINSKSEKKILTVFKKIIDDYEVIILSDYGKGVLTTKLTQQVIGLANANSIKVLVDPKGVSWDKYKGAYLLTPNKAEAELIAKTKIDKSNLERVITQFKNDFNLSKSVITLSEDGIAVFDDKLRIHPTTAKDVFDVTGAGDTVIAALGVQLLNGKNIDEAIKFANLAAGVVVAKIGSATATFDEIYSSQHNIKSFTQIAKIVKNSKENGNKIVFTNGCFDILHLGHIKYLEEAKKLGDILIIGVNTDISVKKLKGNSRPINSEFDRCYLLNALKVVDFVVLFEEDTPYELIKIVQPNVLVKGGDYEGKDVVGRDIAGEVKLISFVDGKSTSNIIDKVKQ